MYLVVCVWYTPAGRVTGRLRCSEGECLMADERSSIFNKQATDRLRSPDDLDKYVRVTTPAVWTLLFSVLAVVIGLLAWGFFGSVSTSVSTTGACISGKTICLLDAEQVAKVKPGDRALVAGEQTTVASIATVPLSISEASETLQSDYLVDALMPGEWAYLVSFEDVNSLDEGVPLSVSITTERVAPVTLVLG